MDAHWGQLQQAFRDTLISQSERHALTRNGEVYGFDRPGGEIPEPAYGDALNQAAYGMRGTFLSMFDVIEGALSALNTSSTWYIDAAYPNKVMRQVISGIPNPDSMSYAERYIRIGNTVHYVQSVDLNTAGLFATTTILHIAAVDSTETSALDSAGASALEVNVILLPFVLRVTQPAPIDEDNDLWSPGENNLLEVLLFSDTLEEVPPSYLVTEDLDVSDTASPVDMPFGSQLVDDNEIGHQLDGAGEDVGPHPIYLVDGTAFPQLTLQLNRLMVAGNECTVRLASYG